MHIAEPSISATQWLQRSRLTKKLAPSLGCVSLLIAERESAPKPFGSWKNHRDPEFAGALKKARSMWSFRIDSEDSNHYEWHFAISFFFFLYEQPQWMGYWKQPLKKNCFFWEYLRTQKTPTARKLGAAYREAGRQVGKAASQGFKIDLLRTHTTRPTLRVLAGFCFMINELQSITVCCLCSPMPSHHRQQINSWCAFPANELKAFQLSWHIED